MKTITLEYEDADWTRILEAHRRQHLKETLITRDRSQSLEDYVVQQVEGFLGDRTFAVELQTARGAVPDPPRITPKKEAKA